MRKLYIALTLGLGTVISIAVSLACSFWFFYSMIGTGGYSAIGAGCAGCALQLFAYGFASYIVNVKRYVFIPVWILMCLMPLGLSIFTTYTTLYGFMNAGEQQVQQNAQHSQLLVDMIEQNKKDREIISAAAEQSLKERYRTQAERLLKNNNQTTKDNIELLDKLSVQQEKIKTTPLDGLVAVTGDSRYAKIIFCAWLSLLFDLLPVVAIAVLGIKKETLNESFDVKNVAHSSKNHTSFRVRDKQKSDDGSIPSETTVLNIASSAACLNSSEKINSFVRISENVTLDIPEFKDRDIEQLLLLVRMGKIEPDYSVFMMKTGMPKWQVQNFFKIAKERGIVEKKGRSLVVINNTSELSLVKTSQKTA